MYKIIKDGETIAITEKLRYIKQNGAGVFIGCNDKDAQGIAVKNTPYNLAGRGAMRGCETVVVLEVDGGDCIQAGEEMQTDTDALIIEHEYRLTLLEMGV